MPTNVPSFYQPPLKQPSWGMQPTSQASSYPQGWKPLPSGGYQSTSTGEKFPLGILPATQSYQLRFDPFAMGEIGKTEAIAQNFKQQRLQDMAEGQKRGMELFGPGSLGRLDEGENKRLLELMRGRMQGYTSPEFGALRDTMNRENAQSYGSEKRNLLKAQGYNGVGGAAGAAQFAQLGKQHDRNAQLAAQDLMIKNIEAKKQGAADFAGALQGLQGVQTANMGRAERELLNRFQTEMGYASLGAAERSAAAQFSAANSQQQQAMQQKDSGKF